MARNPLIYAWTVIATGTAVAASALLLWQPQDIAAFVVCLGLAVLASTFKVTLPTTDGTISPGFVFLLVAIGRLGWSETVAIGVASALVQLLWRRKTRPNAVQIGFNAATMAIAGGLAYGVAHGLAQSAGDPVVFLAVAGVVLLVTNTLLVAAIVCLMKNAPLYTVWRLLQPHVIPYYLAGGVLAGVWSRADLTTSAGVAVMAAVSAYLLSLWYREMGGRDCSAGRRGESCLSPDHPDYFSSKGLQAIAEQPCRATDAVGSALPIRVPCGGPPPARC